MHEDVSKNKDIPTQNRVILIFYKFISSSNRNFIYIYLQKFILVLDFLLKYKR